MNIFFSSAVSWSQSFSRSFGHGVSLAFCGITPSFFWLAKIVLAQLVPALVEQVHVADLLDPLRRRVVRRVACRPARSRRRTAGPASSALMRFM